MLLLRELRKRHHDVRFREIITYVSYANKHCSMTSSYALRVKEIVYASLRLCGMNSGTFFVYVCDFFRIYTKTSRVPDGTRHGSLRGTAIWNMPKFRVS